MNGKTIAQAAANKEHLASDYSLVHTEVLVYVRIYRGVEKEEQQIGNINNLLLVYHKGYFPLVRI